MIYAIDNLLDEDRCYAHLVEYFHKGFLNCSVCGSSNSRVHHRRRAPIVQHQCHDCGAYFNVFSNTAFLGTHWPCSKVVMVLRGFVKGDSTLSMSREMKLGYRNLLYLRHELMGNALENREEGLLEDLETESDEMYQNSGEKGIKHPDPDDPPRRRANKKRGSATGETTDLAYSAPLGGKAVK